MISASTLLLVLVIVAYVARAEVGVDYSQLTSVSSLSCAHDYGYNFAIPRVYMSTGQPDPNGPANINNAWSAGMTHVDGYIFPCFSCGNAAGQMDATIDYLASHSLYLTGSTEAKAMGAGVNGTNSALKATIGMLWVDVEGTQYWSSNQQSNVNFIAEMINEGVARGVSIGIYTSSSQWSPITGGSTQFSSYPLWFANWDANWSACTSTFTPFGGWTSAAMKQYVGDESFCSAGFDKNCW